MKHMHYKGNKIHGKYFNIESLKARILMNFKDAARQKKQYAVPVKLACNKPSNKYTTESEMIEMMTG